jgi:regulatory protein
VKLLIDGGRITCIKTQKGNKNRFSIFLDDEYAFGLDASVLLKFNLKKGIFLTADQVAHISAQEEKSKVLNKAYSLLSRRDHSRKQLFDKLRQRGYSQEIIDEVISELQAAGYLDDTAFACRFAGARLKALPMGKKRLVSELVQKGIDTETAEQAVGEAYSAFDELDVARGVAQKRVSCYRDETVAKRRQKLTGFLRQRGFDWENIIIVVNENI